jgi:hypothetical protein
MSNTDQTKENLVAPVKLDYSADPVIKSTGGLDHINWFNAAITDTSDVFSINRSSICWN